ncbi:MAG: hypothetical protein JO099_20140, partial [Acidobacteriia bacterium]|nr:hypothetical protein [Terriglobia bacterium]
MRAPRMHLAALLMAALPAAAAPPPDFAHQIAPIVYRACAPCHRPGGTAPFALLTYADVSKRVAQIAAVTRTRYMPPWLPEPSSVSFEGERRLTDEEIRAFADWAAAGAPEGSARDALLPPQLPSDWQLGTPDLVLEAPAALDVPAVGPDLYWNFVLKPNRSATAYVRAMEVRPGGGPGLVHHANLLVDRIGSSHNREIAPGKGFGGMDLEIMRSPFDPPGNFLFWKPGSVFHQEPDGFAWRLDPGDELVLNVHLRPTGKLEKLKPLVGLYFTDQRQTRYPLLVQL